MSLEENVSLHRRYILSFTWNANCRVKEANLVRLADCLLSAILRQCTDLEEHQCTEIGNG